MTAYADSSFLVRIYTPHADSQRALTWMQRATEPLPFTPVHRLELRNGIRLRVFRKEVTVEERKAAFREIESDLEDRILVHVAIPLADTLRRAEELSNDHTETVGVRSIDILHVGLALVLGAKDFLTFDKRQAALAKAAGLRLKP